MSIPIKELGERLSVANDTLRIALRALAWYADEGHYGADDWGVLSVIRHPEYGSPGKKARNAIRRIERATAPERVAPALREDDADA